MEHLQGTTLFKTINMYYLTHSYYEMGHIIKPILRMKHREANDPAELQQLVSSSAGS